MRRELFNYELPKHLIAHAPAAERRGSRLLCLDGLSGQVQHRQFPDLLHLVDAGDLLVFNDTRVIPARLFGRKPTGGKVEVMLERILSNRQILAQVRASKAPQPGAELIIDQAVRTRVLERRDDMFVLEFPDDENALAIMENHGHVPLPPYIERADTVLDRERYQTVYAEKAGAVAAPTAGLHFDQEMLVQLDDKGVRRAHVTLHVGAGTFQPVRVENIRYHRMHSEYIEVDENVCHQVEETRRSGGRVVAVGTTSVRCLETAAANGRMEPYRGETDIFIYPGYSFRVVDVLLTNFHLPESTLLMLVSAFAGYRYTMRAYLEAVAEQYRFFSYGDAMFTTRNQKATQEIPR